MGAEMAEKEKRGMMTFDRKSGQRVAVDLKDGRVGWITATIVGDIVRLHLDFPLSVRLDREEVYRQRQERTNDDAGQ